MKVCFFSPYLTNRHAGGGEKHLFDTALVVAKKHQVFIAVSDFKGLVNPAENDLKALLDPQSICAYYEQFMNKPLSSLNFITTPLMSKSGFLKKLLWTKQFDYLYFVTDGSQFFSLAKNNNLHIQTPLVLSKKGIVSRLKLKNWKIKNTNSHFTRKVIESSWQTNITHVHYPMVEALTSSMSLTKKPQILNVGRFFTQLHAKRQDVLIDTFRLAREKYPELFSKFELILVGSVEDEAYFEKVKAQAKDLPVRFYPNIDRDQLNQLYLESQFYWHATGFEVNEMKEPEKVEHFGITTLEAMGAGCIPLVVAKGGQNEVLGPELSWLGWQSKSECIDKTAELMNHPAKRADLVKLCLARVELFAPAKFEERVWQMFDNKD